MLLRITLALGLFVAVGACANHPSAESAPAANAAVAPANGLTRVADPSLVCMINNTFMGRPQIPVEVNGKTYFGCCPVCKERLANEPATRSAVDPVSGETVDKAVAVIAQDSRGSVLYFASEDTMRAYRPAL